MIVRIATDADIPQLVELRMRLFVEVGELSDPAEDQALREATERYFRQAGAEGQSKSWVAVADGAIVATGTLAEFQRPPYPGNLPGKEAYLLNMFTVKAHRRNGIAGELLKQIMAFAQSQGYGKVWLHASPEGRALYERFGFAPNPSEMERAAQ